MSVDREFVDQDADRHAIPVGGVNPFAVVGGLIVTILIASLFLWVLGADEIKRRSQQYTPNALSAVAVDQ